MSKEAMKKALEALEFDGFVPKDLAHRSLHAKAITAIKQALAAPVQEPVAWVEAWLDGKVQTHEENCFSADPAWLNDPIPLYTAPPKREWVGLTDEEIDELYGSPMELEHSGALKWVRVIEAKLKEKNT